MAGLFISDKKYYHVTHFPVVVKLQRWEQPCYEVVESAKELRQVRGEIIMRENAGEWTFLGYYEMDKEIH